MRYAHGRAAIGLSPRVRGNLEVGADIEGGWGSIPACAGEPRILGAMPNAAQGLSPRVRGNLAFLAQSNSSRRSIPACAGEPLTWARLPCQPPVYPRVCGGTVVRRSSASVTNGLSPRVRGNLSPAVHNVAPRGSIPACAGEPRRSARLGAGASVYPRVCGGTSLSWVYPFMMMGLSPRVRGNHVRATERQHRGGSIPACAGEPLPAQARPAPLPVYPRVCGGTYEAGIDRDGRLGLSPRVRGTRVKKLCNVLE